MLPILIIYDKRKILRTRQIWCRSGQQTSVTFYSTQDDLIRFQLNDKIDSEGNREYISYNKEVDVDFVDQVVVAEIVEGDKNQTQAQKYQA